MPKLIEDNWNKAIKKNRHSIKARDYISMSDLGKAYIDRYYKMRGEPPTNDYDERILRIFEAGRVMEFIVLRALTMAGILNQKQTFVEIPKTDKTLRLLGYLDATIGGFTDWGKAKDIIIKHLGEYKLNLDDQLLEQKAVGIIDGLKERYPDGKIPEMFVEVKSINSLAFWSHNNRDRQGNFIAYDHNKLQLYGYMKATKIERGTLLYISKDDFVIQEDGIILGNEKLEELFNNDITTMSNFYLTNTEPPKLQKIIFNERKKVFELNWEVKRSVYLTKIYGYKIQEEFEDKNKSKLNEINLTLKRLRELDKEKDEKRKKILEKKISVEQEIINLYKLNEIK